MSKHHLLATAELGAEVLYLREQLHDEITPTGPCEYNNCEGTRELGHASHTGPDCPLSGDRRRGGG